MSKEEIFKINKVPIGNDGKEMTEKYINELQESSLPKEMIASFTGILNDFLDVFDTVEKKHLRRTIWNVQTGPKQLAQAYL